MSHFFNKLWGKRRDAAPTAVKKRPKLSATTSADRQRNAVIDALERQRLQWLRYVESRKYRLEKLGETYPGVGRYREALRKMLKDPECEWTGARDCNVDLAEFAERLGLSKIPGERDRFLLLEISRDFIAALGKRQGIGQAELVDDPDPFSQAETELDRVKAVLNLR